MDAQRFSPKIVLVVLVSGLLAFSGCSPQVATPSSHNRDFVTADGFFVGHLKPVPEEGPPRGPDGKPIQPHDKVVWVIEGDNVSQPLVAYDVQTYRLDFNEKEKLTENVLPYALMTEKTREVVIHRGPPPATLSHPKINSGEPLLPVYQCGNHQCPRVQAVDNFALFPVATDDKQPKCPFCGNTSVEPFLTPQHKNMRDFMQRHP